MTKAILEACFQVGKKELKTGSQLLLWPCRSHYSLAPFNAPVDILCFLSGSTNPLWFIFLWFYYLIISPARNRPEV